MAGANLRKSPLDEEGGLLRSDRARRVAGDCSRAGSTSGHRPRLPGLPVGARAGRGAAAQRRRVRLLPALRRAARDVHEPAAALRRHHAARVRADDRRPRPLLQAHGVRRDARRGRHAVLAAARRAGLPRRRVRDGAHLRRHAFRRDVRRGLCDGGGAAVRDGHPPPRSERNARRADRPGRRRDGPRAANRPGLHRRGAARAVRQPPGASSATPACAGSRTSSTTSRASTRASTT